MFQTLKYNNFIIWYLKLMKFFSYFMGWMHLFLVSPFRIKTLEFLLTIVIFTTWNKISSIIASISLYGFVSFSFSFELAYISNGASLNNEFFICLYITLVWNVLLKVCSKPHIDHPPLIMASWVTCCHIW